MSMRIIGLLLIGAALCSAQTGKDYFPTVLGEMWNYQTSVLDSMQQPIAGTATFSKTVFAGGTPIETRPSFMLLTNTAGLTDTTILSVTDTTISRLVRPGSFFNGLAFPSYITSGIGNALTGWYPYLQFKAHVNTPYTLYEFDTTITIDTLVSLPLRVRVSGTRRLTQTITVPAGTFTTQPFDITTTVSVIVASLAFPILSLTDTMYLAQGKWIVKEIQLSTQFPYISIPTLPILAAKIPGYEKVLVSYITDVPRASDTPLLPLTPVLSQNYPNPFNPETEIHFVLPVRQHVRLAVYDLVGREIALLVDGIQVPGEHTVRWSAEGQSSGTYFYKLQTDGYSVTRRMAVLR